MPSFLPFRCGPTLWSCRRVNSVAFAALSRRNGAFKVKVYVAMRFTMPQPCWACKIGLKSLKRVKPIGMRIPFAGGAPQDVTPDLPPYSPAGFAISPAGHTAAGAPSRGV